MVGANYYYFLNLHAYKINIWIIICPTSGNWKLYVIVAKAYEFYLEQFFFFLCASI